MDNNVDKLIEFCKEHKGDVFDVNVYNKTLPCTLVGYNHRNGKLLLDYLKEVRLVGAVMFFMIKKIFYCGNDIKLQIIIIIMYGNLN